MTAWTRGWVAALSGAALSLLSTTALGSPPEPPPEPSDTPVVAVEAAQGPPASAPLEGDALRIVEGPTPPPMPESSVAPLPLEPVPLGPVPCVAPRSIGERPPVGTGLLVGSVAGLVGASVMVMLATLGRDEVDLRRNQALGVGLAAIPIGAMSSALLISGVKAHQRYARWESDNALDAPASGNGLLVAGVVLGGVGALATSLAIDHNRGLPNPDSGDRVLTALSLTTLGSGVLLLGGGVIQRARFSGWEGAGYLRPGFYANRGGGGLSLTGRF